MSPGAFSGGNGSGISTTNSFGFNYRDQWSKRISVYGSYSYNHKNTSQLQTSSTQSFYQGSGNNSFINNQDVNNLTTGNSHRFTFNFEYQIDSFNYLKISPSVNYSGSEANNRNMFDYSVTDGTKTSDGTNKSFTNSKAPNLAATILFNHKFRKRAEFFNKH